MVMFQSDLLILFSEALQHVMKALWVQERVVPGKGAAGKMGKKIIYMLYVALSKVCGQQQQFVGSCSSFLPISSFWKMGNEIIFVTILAIYMIKDADISYKCCFACIVCGWENVKVPSIQ